MGSPLFGFVAGFGLTWVFMELRRDGYWREFNTRRRGSNPPPPGRKPAPPAGPRYGWGAGQLPPPPPAPGMRREWLWSQSQMAECGGPCWEAQDPRHCVCGALWRDVPIRMDEGQTQRGNGNGGATTPKPPIKPQPYGGRQVGDLLKPKFPPASENPRRFLVTDPTPEAAPPAAPAGGLVDLVGEAMERHHVIGDIEGSWDAQARAAIREVAAWIRSDLNGRSVADRLEQEAGRCLTP